MAALNKKLHKNEDDDSYYYHYVLFKKDKCLTDSAKGIYTYEHIISEYVSDRLSYHASIYTTAIDRATAHQ